ncbi:MAG: protein kinase, partial [Myxococcales bacterium]|nr:protein kinase [Myxococcales bacterium]
MSEDAPNTTVSTNGEAEPTVREEPSASTEVSGEETESEETESEETESEETESEETEAGATQSSPLHHQFASTLDAGGLSDDRSVSSPRRSAPTLDGLPTVSPEHYEDKEEFARGGIGRITRAHDRRLDRVVAIKELRRMTDYAMARFAREVAIAARLEHPNIVPVYEAGRWPSGEPFFAMKLVDGGSLEDAIGEATEVGDHLALVRHVAAVADAMAYAHSQGIVHRDLKPANVLLGPFDETVVIDWGLAKDLHAPDLPDLPPGSLPAEQRDHYQTMEGVVLGTPPYMPPEQAGGAPVDERADIYAIGAVLYHALSGRVPYAEFHPRDIVNKVLTRPPTPLSRLVPELPADLLAIVDKAMARNKDRRYATCRELAEDLDAFLTGGLVGAYQYSGRELLRRFVRRERAAVITGVVAALALTGVGVYSLARITEQRNRAQAAQGEAERLAQAEREAHEEAERRSDENILTAARSAVDTDPTRAVALLKRLAHPLDGAATVAADAIARGVSRHVLVAHDDRIDTVAVSADAKWLATSGWDAAVVLWHHQGARYQPRRLDGHEGRVPVLAFGEGSLVSGGYDGALLRWGLDGAKTRLLDESGPIRALALEGEAVWAVAEDGLRRWSPSGVQAWPLRGDRPLFASWSPDGRHLVTGSHQGELRIWSRETRESIALVGHEGEVNAAVFADAATVASAGSDGTVRLWSLDGRQERVFDGHAGSVETVAVRPNGEIVSGGIDGAVRIWSRTREDSDLVVRHGERVTTLALTSDGRTIASASWDKTIRLHDRVTRSTRVLAGHRDVVSSIAFTEGDQLLASVSWDATLRLWPVERDTARTIAAHRVGAKAVAVSPDGKLIASGGHDDLVRVWDAETGALVARTDRLTGPSCDVRFSPDGRWLASGWDSERTGLWSVPDLHPRSVTTEGFQRALAWSEDGRWLAIGGQGPGIR